MNSGKSARGKGDVGVAEGRPVFCENLGFFEGIGIVKIKKNFVDYLIHRVDGNIDVVDALVLADVILHVIVSVDRNTIGKSHF